MDVEVSQFLDYIGTWLSVYGYLAILVWYPITAVVPQPFFEEVYTIIFGYFSGRNDLYIFYAIPSVIVGVFMSDCLAYGVGRFIGKGLFSIKILRFLFPEKKIKKGQAFVEKHGIWAIILSRFIFGLRSPIYISTGLLKYPFKKLVLIFCFTIPTHVIIYFSLGYFFYKDIEKLIGFIFKFRDYFMIAIGIIAFVIVIILVIRHIRKKKSIN